MTDQGDWYTMQMLKTDIERLRKLGTKEHKFEIEANQKALDCFKKKALIESSN